MTAAGGGDILKQCAAAALAQPGAACIAANGALAAALRRELSASGAGLLPPVFALPRLKAAVCLAPDSPDDAARFGGGQMDFWRAAAVENIVAQLLARRSNSPNTNAVAREAAARNEAMQMERAASEGNFSAPSTSKNNFLPPSQQAAAGLARWGAARRAPVFVLDHPDYSAADRAFFKSLPQAEIFTAPTPPLAESLLQQWRGDVDSIFKNKNNGDNEAAHFAEYVFAAPAGAHDAALAALTAVEKFIAALREKNISAARDEGRVAVVVHDRRLARHLRAMAAARGHALRDETGWRADSIAAGAMWLAWLDVVFADGEFSNENNNTPAANDGARRWDLFLQNQHLFGMRAGGEGGEAAYKQLRQWRRRWNGAPAAPPPLSPAPPVNDARASVAWKRWLEWLLKTSSAPPMAAWLDETDAAAASLPEFIRACAAVADDETKMTAAEFVAWLRGAMRARTVRTDDGAAEVAALLTSPGLAQMRRFGAVVVLGLAPPPPDSAAAAKTAPRLAALVAAHRLAAFINIDDEKPVFAPLAQLRADVNKPEWNWKAEAAGGLLAVEDAAADSFLKNERGRAAPGVAPAAMSATGYQELMDCPYRFWARRLLRLAEEEPEEEMTPLERGSAAHEALAAWLQNADDNEDVNALAARLAKLAAEKFSASEKSDAQIHGARLAARAPELAAVFAQERGLGWRPVLLEAKMEKKIDGGVVLRGRLDRVDRRGRGENSYWRIIDYKTGAPPTKKKISEGDNVQLAFYAALLRAAHAPSSARVLASFFNPLTGQQAEVEMPPEFVSENEARLRLLLTQLAAGAPLPANAAAAHCENCEAAGLCRRAHWDDA